MTGSADRTRERKIYMYLFIALVGYYVVFVSDSGNLTHGGSLLSFVAILAAAVVTVFSLFELSRVLTSKALKVVCYVAMLPPLGAILLFLGTSLTR